MTSLTDDIVAFIDAHKMTARRFGELSLNDKNFVNDLKSGRSPSLNTAEKVRRFMMTYREQAA